MKDLLNLHSFSEELELRDGIFFAKKDRRISYPEAGNEDFFQIEDNSFWFKHRNNCIIRAVQKFNPSSIFFDIGGGNGYIAKGLAQHDITSVLIEPGISGCLNAKKRNLEFVVCSTLEDAHFKANTIEAIGLFDVIEHIEDDMAFLESVHSYLKPGGNVYITVPAFRFLWSREDVDAGHFRRYTLDSLEQKLKAKGFVIRQSTYIFSILPIAVFLFRTLPSAIGLHKNSSDLNKHKKEHSNKSGVLASVMERIWRWELQRIAAGKKIGVGGSCFVVAQKPDMRNNKLSS